MSTPKKLRQEDFYIETDNASALRLVRPERYTPSAWQASLRIGDASYDVLNYSAFGIAVLGNSLSEELSPGAVTQAQILLESRPIQEIYLRVVYNDSLPDGQRKIGFELQGGAIDTEKLAAVVQGMTVAISMREKITAQRRIREDYRLAVLEFEDFVGEVKAQLEEVEAQWVHLPPQVKSSKEQGVSFAIEFFFDEAMTGHFRKIERTISDLSGEERVEHMAFFRDKLMKYLTQAPFANRSYFKPAGYSGDYEMMNIIYRDTYEGGDLFARCLHKHYLGKAPARAVRNRAAYLETKIRETLETSSKRGEVSIMSVASGPAVEIQRLLKGKPLDLDYPAKIVLVDQDINALQHAQQKIRELSFAKESPKISMQYRHAAIKNIIASGLNEDDGYDLIYSAGLFDYLSDAVAMACIRQLHKALKPGGRLVIGNFDISNPSKMEMEVILDWKLIYRTHEEMRRLAAMVDPHATVEAEAEGVNIFVVVRK